MTETTATLTDPAQAVLPFEPTLDGLLAWAEAEHAKQVQGLPSEWDQGHWAIARPDGTPIAASCATACCLAGKIVASQGGRFILDTDYGMGYQVATSAGMPNGQWVDVEGEATRILGITYPQAEALFEGDNTIEDVRRIIQAIKDGDPEPLGHDDWAASLDDEYDTW